jgi:hypothetical protein
MQNHDMSVASNLTQLAGVDSVCAASAETTLTFDRQKTAISSHSFLRTADFLSDDHHDTMPGWAAPPTRRELLVLLFSVSIFICAYNADVIFTLFNLSYRPYSPFAPARPPPIGPDGRKPESYRDALEDEIFGTWDWESGRIAGVETAEMARVKGENEEGEKYIHGEGETGLLALWLQGVGRGEYTTDSRLGSTTVNDEFVRWGENVPRTKVLFHIPGKAFQQNS